MDAYARLEEGRGRRSSSPTDDFFRPYLSDNSKPSLIDMLPRGWVAIDREFMLQLCAQASPSTTKEAVLTTLKGPEAKTTSPAAIGIGLDHQ
jgi:hypothetical protein